MKNQSNNRQFLFQSLLIVQTIILVAYTAYAAKNEGWVLFQIITSNINSFSWNGQFNLDFSCYLMLSGLWIMWRNKFSISSMLIALVAAIIGIMVFAPYLFYLLIIEKGDMKTVILGER